MIRLLNKAKAIYGSDNVSLCGFAKEWKDCFTIENDILMFWFNIGVDTKIIKG